MDPLSLAKNRRLEITSALSFYLSVALCLIFAVAFAQYLERKDESQRWKATESSVISNTMGAMASDLNDAVTDVLLLADKPELFARTASSNKLLANEFSRIEKARRSYYQMRFFDTSGAEIVRVDFRNGKTTNIPVNQLQNKSHRPYFQSAMKLKPDELFISRLDLNVENSKIETPYQPVIRFAFKVRNHKNQTIGILLISYNAEKILRLVELNNRQNQASLMMLNSDGYWLYSENLNDRWGFQLTGNRKIQDKYPEWSQIKNSPVGQEITRNGLFTWATVGVLQVNDSAWQKKFTAVGNVKLVREEEPWTILSVVDRAILYSDSRADLKRFGIVAAILMVVLIPISVRIGKLRAMVREHRNRIQAYAKIIERTDELIYITDEKGKILFTNPAFEQHTGYKAQDVIGRDPSFLKSGIHAAEFYQDLWETISQGKRFEALFVNKKKDGSLFYEEKAIMPSRKDNGEIAFYVSCGRDIADAYRNKQREMQIASRISAGIAHHFNNLLSSISGYTELALLSNEKGRTEEVTSYLQQSLYSTDRAAKLVSRMLSLQHSQLAGLPLESVPNLVREIVHDYLERSKANIRVDVLVEDEVSKVRVHNGLFATAINALLENANDAMHGNGRIELLIKQQRYIKGRCATCGEPLQGSFVEISVSDRGDGIDPQIQAQIFDPFFSVKEKSLLVGASPGLGLTAVRAIMHAHQGHLNFQSEVGKGTRVSLLFPVPPSEQDNSYLLETGNSTHAPA